MATGIYNKLNSALAKLAAPAILHFFYQPNVGQEYGFGLAQKRSLHKNILRTTKSIVSATSPLEHLILASAVLSLPKDIKGDLIECGCFKGSSTSTLSLLAKATGRKIVVCNSFEGLPEISGHDKLHVSEMLGRYELYEKGEYCGQLDEVKANVAKHGDASVCSWIKGYFENTLPSLQGNFAFVFLDVDLFDSLKDCLKYIWPLMNNGALLYTHEARQLDFTKLFFNDQWWLEHIDQPSPGLIGAGSGIAAGISKSCGLGWIRKSPLEMSERTKLLQGFQGDPTKAQAQHCKDKTA